MKKRLPWPTPLAKAFKQKRLALGLSQEQLAAKVRQSLPADQTFTQQTYGAFEAGVSQTSRHSLAIAAALGITSQEVDAILGSSAARDGSGAYSTDQLKQTSGRPQHLLPVIGYVQAGAFCEAVDNFQPGDAEEWIDAGGPAGPRSFVLVVEGFSMAPTINPKEKVVIDPDAAYEPGHIVLAKRAADSHVTLKQLRKEGNEFYLFAVNPDWPDKYIKLNEEWHVCGRATRKIVEL